ncbi:MAG: hypothetical protein M3O23_09035 [Actinomycetota bacterium]|nr:hypothetical protein [Actinomycetota bacterium]
MGLVGFGGAALAVALGATAWACIAGPLLTVNPSTVQAGQEVNFTATSLNRDQVTVRFDSLDGPVLGTFTPGPDPRFPTSSTSGGLQNVKLTIPADASPGNHVLILTQAKPDGKLSQVPTRVLVTVTGSTGATPVAGAPVFPVDETRPEGLVTGDEGVSTGTKVLVGLGVAGVAMFLAGMAAMLASRRPSGPEPAAARVSGTK